MAISMFLALQAMAAPPEADGPAAPTNKPALLSPQGDGKGLKFQHLFDNGADLALSAQYSSLFGFVAVGELSLLIGDDGAAYLRLHAGPNLREALLRSGVRFAEDRGIAIVTVRELRNQLNYQFQGGSEAESWMREALYGAELTWKVSDMSLSGYAAYRKAPSKSLGYSEYNENLADLYRHYQIEQRIAGGTVSSAGLKADWLISPAWAFWLNAGIERRSMDYQTGEHSRTGATGSMGLDWRSDNGLAVKLQAGAAIQSITGSLMLDYPLNEGWSSYLKISGERDTEIDRNNATGEIGLRYSFGGKTAATSAGRRAANQPVDSPTADSKTSDPQADALKHNQVLAATGYSQSELRRLVTHVPQYANSLLVNAHVDNTVKPELLIEINKRGLDSNTTLDTETGNLTITAPGGGELGELEQFTQTFAGTTSALPLNLLRLSSDRKSATLTVQPLKNHLVTGSSAAAPAELKAVFRNYILILQAYQGSVHIISSKLVVNTANQDRSPPELIQPPTISVVKDRLATLGLMLNEAGTVSYLLRSASMPAPAVGLFSSEGQRLNVSANTPASINLNGLTPATAYTLYVQARDVAGNPQSGYTTVTFTTTEEQLPPTMDDVPDQTLNIGSAFSLSLAAYARLTNGDPITSYTLASGSLPADLTLNTSTGLISGTPTTTGTYTVLVAANDKDGTSNTDSFTFTVNPSADTTPDAFSFIDQTGVALATLTESAPITVAGINTVTPISVSAGEYSINGGTWTSVAGTVTNGQTIKVRHTSSVSNATATNTVLTIGGVAETFITTTLAAVPTDVVTVNGTPTVVTNSDTKLTVTNHIADPDGIKDVVYRLSLWVPPSITPVASNGTGVFEGLTAGATYHVKTSAQAKNSATGTFAEVVSPPVLITLPLPVDTTPDLFSFVGKTSPTVSTIVVSDAIAVTGIDTPTNISITGGEYQIGSAGWTSGSGSVANGQSVKVRVMSTDTPGTTASAMLSIGGVTREFAVTNAANVTPTLFVSALADQLAGTISGNYTVTTGDANGGVLDVYLATNDELLYSIVPVTSGAMDITTDLGNHFGLKPYKKWQVPVGTPVKFKISVSNTATPGFGAVTVLVRDPQGASKEALPTFSVIAP